MAADNEMGGVTLGEPRMEDRKSLLIAGLMKNYTSDTMQEIPALWKDLVPHMGKLPGQMGDTSYGVVYDLKNGGGFAYLAGMEVENASDVPDEFSVVRLPEMRYAVFVHEGHVSKLKHTVGAIMKWLPESGLRLVRTDEEMPEMMEQYGEGFDPRSGSGVIELWVPIKNRAQLITFESGPGAESGEAL